MQVLYSAKVLKQSTKISKIAVQKIDAGQTGQGNHVQNVRHGHGAAEHDELRVDQPAAHAARPVGCGRHDEGGEGEDEREKGDQRRD